MSLSFATSPRSSVGIEWELQLVDADSGDLRQAATSVLDGVAGPDGRPHPHVHPELLLNTVEVVSGVNRTVGGAGADLARAIEDLRPVTEALRIELASAGTHPFASPAYQRVTDKERYATLIDRTRWWGRQMLLYGVHVHVGIEDRAKVLPIIGALLTRFAHLQSLAASSPFWGGEDTGYASNRAMMFQQLPTAGVPYQFTRWGDLEAYVEDMTRTGVIDTFSELRWDIRPAPALGTIEVRVCDAATNLQEVLAISALTHCLVEHYSERLDAGETLPTVPPWFVAENKWRSARYGMDAILILDDAGEEELVTDTVTRMLDELAPVAERLGCVAELGDVRRILDDGASYQRQLRVAERGGLDGVVASMVAEMRAGHPL
ncbi:glutamate--cysteine ligase [Georgenia thermotolerans]|uniref:Putative glutamate--cysteine ligase 2 n=1 Tax=Georgenia thermotolerans TaxID=527326 RepID=A0A7J5UM90_9MICO|nr:glutamate--cysteine ligase [Georgenia thermotolerans]KAE8763488.1 glutamate--cysteine ligase [Georgenia thermotolerans]